MNKIIQLNHDKKYGSIMCVIPMKDESHSNMFEQLTTSATWVYYNDGKPHKNHRINHNIPAIVNYPIIDIWGGESDVRDAGYRKHWLVFLDTNTNKYYFGNYPEFIKSRDPEEVRQALNMMVVDINMLIDK